MSYFVKASISASAHKYAFKWQMKNRKTAAKASIKHPSPPAAQSVSQSVIRSEREMQAVSQSVPVLD